MIRTLIAVLVALVASASALAEPHGGTFPVDPVMLVDGGHGVAGNPAITSDHGAFRYVFANHANKGAFESAPERYEVQMGGACARMGPLSGCARPDLYTVHDERIYIFASEGCRNAFLANVDRMIEKPDPCLEFTTDQAQRGRELLEQAIAAHGGAERLDALKNVVIRREWLEETNAAPAKNTSTLTLVFGRAIHQRDTWDDLAWGHVATLDDAFTYGSSGAEPLAPVQVMALGRVAAANPLAILRARVHPDFTVGALEPAKIGEAPVDRIEVWFHGFAATVALDPATHRVVAITCKDRGPSMLIGEIEQRFTAYGDAGGVALPTHVETRFEMEPWPQRSGPVDCRVDVAIDEGALVRPRAG